jgi:F420-dependent oxidoreductase-like protein
MTSTGRNDLLFGLHMPSFTFPDTPDAEIFDRVIDNVRAAESAGFDLVTVMDHFYQIATHGEEREPMLEAYTLLGALAARTERVQLATMVTGVTYRNPALLAKQITTLDVISKGRAVLGIGAAWHDVEHVALGIDFPPIKERMDRLEEAVQICRLMFTEERPSFSGRHYQIDEALNYPRPIQTGGPPILVGGSGERRTLRIVAKYADWSNWFGPLDELRHKIDVLDRYCDEIGRDPATIRRTVMVPIALVADERETATFPEALPSERRGTVHPVTPERAAEFVQPYLDLGFRGLLIRNNYLKSPDRITNLAGEFIRLVRRVPVAA